MKKRLILVFLYFCLMFVCFGTVYAKNIVNESPKKANDLEYKTIHNSYVANTEEALDDLYMKLGDEAVSLEKIKNDLEEIKDLLTKIRKEAENYVSKEESKLSNKERLLRNLATNLIEPELIDYGMNFYYNNYLINVNYDGYTFSSSYPNIEAYNSMTSIQDLIEIYVFEKNGKTIDDYIEAKEKVDEKIKNANYNTFVFGNYDTNGFEKNYKTIKELSNTFYSWKFKISSKSINFNDIFINSYEDFEENNINKEKDNDSLEIENPNTGVGILILVICFITAIYGGVSTRYKKYYKI